MNYKDFKVKLIVGYRRDQEHSISVDEAHKAYHLFLHPEQRGVFNNGLAIKGDQITEIVPDYHGTMGWNPSHNIDADDWNEIRNKNIDVHMQRALKAAKDIATLQNAQDFNAPLSELLETKYPYLEKLGVTGTPTGGMKKIGDAAHGL